MKFRPLAGIRHKILLKQRLADFSLGFTALVGCLTRICGGTRSPFTVLVVVFWA